jgi:hypothetical protein
MKFATLNVATMKFASALNVAARKCASSVKSF